MSFRARVTLVFVWLASLVAVGALAREQAYQMTPRVPPRIISGGDVGFRVEGTMGGRPAGQLVIRVDGEWVEPQYSMRTRPSTTK
jgi:hypothetical protein